MITKKQINRAVSHLDLYVVGNGDGYFYFVCKRTGSTIGSSCLWPRLNDVSLDRWLAEAEAARQSGIVDGSALDEDEKWLARYGANWTVSTCPKKKICILPEHG